VTVEYRQHATSNKNMDKDDRTQEATQSRVKRRMRNNMTQRKRQSGPQRTGPKKGQASIPSIVTRKRRRLEVVRLEEELRKNRQEVEEAERSKGPSRSCKSGKEPDVARELRYGSKSVEEGPRLQEMSVEEYVEYLERWRKERCLCDIRGRCNTCTLKDLRG
jgi:hypothetical protein